MRPLAHLRLVDGPAPSEDVSLRRLHGLLEVTRLVRGDADLPTLLAAIARTVAESLGFATVAVNLYRPEWDDFSVATVHGNEAARDALLGQPTGWEFWRPLLDERFLCRGAYLIRHGEFDWDREPEARFVPELASNEAPDAWHAEDALLVPMEGSDGKLLGILSIDEPASGRLPSDDELDVLVAVAAHAALAVEQAQSAVDATRHRKALEQLVGISSHLTAALSVDALLQSVCESVRGVLGFGTVALALLQPGDDRLTVRGAAGWTLADAAANTGLSGDELTSLLDPAFECEGCYLVPAEDAAARVAPERRTYVSAMNGRGARAWNRHWLLVPLRDRDDRLTGVLWLDEPEDRLLPSTGKLQALRLFANQVTTALDFAAQFGALRETNDRRRSLVASAPLGILELDREGRIRAWNPAAERMFGLTEREALGYRNPVVPEDRLEEFQAILERVLAGESVSGIELRRRHADGSELDVLLSAGPVRDARGEITGVIGAYMDVSEQRRAEEALRQSQELYRRVVEHSNDLIALVDLEGRLLYVSPAQERILGHRAEDVVGSYFARFVHPDDLAGSTASMQGCLAGETPEPFTARLRHADGSWRLLEGVPAAIFDERGEPELVVAVGRDVTERRTLEDQLRQSQKLEAIGRLAGGIAHDFNNLLLAIGAYGELALGKVRDDEPELRRHLEDIRRTCERASALTRQLLAFGRKQVLQPRILDLNDVVGDLESMLGRLLGEEVTLVTALEPALGRTRADASQLEQVIVNLAINARDAMPTGGRLTIATVNADLDDPYVARHVGVEPGSYVVLAVTDTGEGMDAETQAQIFEPFFTTKPAGQGTGLGLATVYGIVRQSGGSIWVYSEPGRGTSFKVYLPRVDDLRKPRREEAAAPARRPETVLVVEDDEVVRAVVRETLELQGYGVLAAASAADALALVTEHELAVDLVVTDVDLPGTTGPELAERLAARMPGLRVLFTSGYGEDPLAREGAAFLEKPFSTAVLAERVRTLLDS